MKKAMKTGRSESYRELATVCRRKHWRLRLCSDRDHIRFTDNQDVIHGRLSCLEVWHGADLLARVKIGKDQALDRVAAEMLDALGKAHRL